MPPQLPGNGDWVDDPNWVDDDNTPSLWERANTPLITLPSELARSAGDVMTEHSLDESMWGSRLRGFGAGALQGVGDLISGLTSPLGLATTLATAGEGTAIKAGLPAIGKALGYGAKGAGALYATHGGMEIGQGAMEGDLGRMGRGTVELAGGALGMRGVTPKGPAKVMTSDQLIEDIGKTATIKRADASKFTPEEFSQLNEFMGKGADEAELASIREGAAQPSKTPVRQQIDLAKAAQEGWVDDTSPKTTAKGPRKLGEGVYDEFASYREVPVGTTYKLSPKDMPRKKLNEAIKLGFDYQGLTDDGKIIIKKVKESPTPDLVETSPGQLGVKTDVKSPSTFWETYNLSRGLMAAADFSAPLRQGLGLIHKKEFWTAMPEMFKAWKTEEGFRAAQNDIANRPMFRKTIGADGKVKPSFAERAGLALTDLTDITKREESLVSTWAEKVPLVRRSNRAYTVFLNKLRADTFESLANDSKVFGPDIKTNLPLAQSLADFVNVATGRSSLGKLDNAANHLNKVLFSPRLIASRLRMLDPRMYLMGPKVVRMEALKSLFAIAAVGNTLTQLGKLAGGTVSMDPSSSDFGKLRIGNTRIDPYGGFQQYIVAANRLLNPLGPATGFEGGTPFTRGQMTTSSNVQQGETGSEYDLWNPRRPFDPNWGDVAWRFGRGKLHPVLGFAVGLAQGAKELSGAPMNFTTLNPMDNAVTQRFIPILAQDLYELSQQSPELLPIVGPLAALGMGQQTYGPTD